MRHDLQLTPTSAAHPGTMLPGRLARQTVRSAPVLARAALRCRAFTNQAPGLPYLASMRLHEPACRLWSRRCMRQPVPRQHLCRVTVWAHAGRQVHAQGVSRPTAGQLPLSLERPIGTPGADAKLWGTGRFGWSVHPNLPVATTWAGLAKWLWQRRAACSTVVAACQLCVLQRRARRSVTAIHVSRTVLPCKLHCKGWLRTNLSPEHLRGANAVRSSTGRLAGASPRTRQRE